MTHRTLQRLIGRAIVDKYFRDDLLNGKRQEAIAEFNLTHDERIAICSIEAGSFEEFASKLHDWIEAAYTEPQDQPKPLSGFLS